MFNRKDPLIDSVKKVMAENEVRRQAEKDLNEELGIASKKALPFEHHKNYDALLEQKITEALKGDQHKIDANQNNKIDAQDFKILKAKKNVDEALKGNQAAIDANKNNKVDAQDFKILSAKKEMSEGIGDKEGTAGTVKKDGKDVVPDSEAKNPHMQASDDKPVPTPPARPKDLKEADYSAKAARAGKDIGKPGKNFKKIADMAAKRYGSEESGKKVAGAILAKIRAKKMDEEIALSEEGNAEYHSELPAMHKDLKANKKSTSQMRREYGSSWKRLLHHTNQNYDKATRENVIAMAKKHMSEVNEETLSENLKTHFKNWTRSEDAPRDDQSGDDNAVHRKAMKYLSGTNVSKEKHDEMAEKLTNMFHGMKESVNENHVLYTHPKADIKVVRKGEGSKEGAHIEVHKGGKKVASGDYDRGADAFFMNVGGKGQKSFDTAKDIANHFHGLSEQFQQLEEKAPEGAKYERMVKHIKAGYSKDGKLTDKEKSIAYATAWKAKNKKMEEGFTAEQVMAEIRKNLGEDKFNSIDEGILDTIKDIGTGIKNALTPTPNNNVPDPEGTVERPGQDAQSRMKPPSTVTSTEPNRVPSDTKPSDMAAGRAAERGSDERTQAKPTDMAAGRAAERGTPGPAKPTAPAAPKPAAPKPAQPKDDIWDDSKIQRTGEGGTETAADFQRNSEIYKQRIAQGGQRPAPSAPAPARPEAPRPATPTPSRPYSPPLSMSAGRMAMREDVEQPTKLSFNDTITKILKG